MVSTSKHKLKLNGERAKRKANRLRAKRKADNLSAKREVKHLRAKLEANHFKSASPYFVRGITSYSLSSGKLVVPTMFARTHLQGVKEVQLQNVRGDIWNVKLHFYSQNGYIQALIFNGWKTFCHDNGLTKEAYCVFELVTEILFKVHIYMFSSMSSCKESRRCNEADLNFDYSSSKDSGFSENCVSHGGSSSSSRGVDSSSSSLRGGASLSSSEGSCFIIEGNRHSSMAGSPARVKSKCKKTREGSNGGGPATRTRGASCRQAVTFSDRGAVSAPDVGVQRVDIDSQAPEVVGDSVDRGTPCCDTGVAKDVSPADLERTVPKASPRLVIDYELEMVEGFPVPSRYTGLYKRIFNRHGHLVSSDLISSDLISSVPKLVLVAVAEALVVIGEIDACVENELSMKGISNWETCLVAMEPIGLRVGWVLSRLKELKDIVTSMDLVKEARVAAPRLAKNVESAKVKLAEAESAMATNDWVLNHADKVALTSWSLKSYCGSCLSKLGQWTRVRNLHQGYGPVC